MRNYQTLHLDKATADVIKFLAAIVVVLHHYSQYVEINHISGWIGYKLLSSQGGYVGVAVFFFLSGFGLMESEKRSHLSAKRFFQRRFMKVYLPVLAVTFIWYIASPFLVAKSSFETAIHVTSMVATRGE